MSETSTNLSAPHSKDAEEALLGSVLINPESYYEVAAFLSPPDFFILRNGWLWAAMERLQERGEVIDYLTLIEELRSQDRLDEVGGSAYIAYLVSNTATAIHAETYGRIISRAALRRRMLKAAEEITQFALEEDADINTVIDKAESVFFAVTENKSRQDLVPLQYAVSEYFDRIEHLHLHQGEPLGVPSGFTDLDQILGGFQKSDLLILAARPGMGKTSLMLNVGMNAARHKARVAIFSLEMSSEQLVQRLISTETGIDSQKLRLGKLDDREWNLFVQATGSLNDLRIHLDDTPALSVMQLRSKCRRLYREQGLDLVVVDYLQLMSAGGRIENRVQEISYISRGLKEIARELNVPVIAGAQLSRAVEQRTDKRPVLSDLRESGCLTGDTLITLADSGREVPIRDLVWQRGFNVWALNEDTLKIEKAAVSNAFSTGVKPVYRLTTQLGRSIRATANHPFRSMSGWKRLDELCVGDYLAVPRKLESPSNQTMSPAELGLLGHLIGDGCTLPRHAIQYTTRDIDLAETVEALAVEVFMGEISPRIKKERDWYQVYLSSTQRLTHYVRNPIAVWLDGLGVWGLRSYEKFIPSKVFEQSEDSIALFLRHLWATDGSIKLISGKKLRPVAYYATSSFTLGRGVQSLLLRIGINARLTSVSQGTKGRTQYHVTVTGIPDLTLFANTIKAVGRRKLSSLAEVCEYLATHKGNTNRDVIPREVWGLYAIPAMKKSGISSREMQRNLETAYNGTALYKQNVSRDRALRLGKAVQSNEITCLASSDVYWDSIASIEYDGEEEVFDLTVPGQHNFVANNIIVHNSIEQDADIVMFIYRDDIYNEASERPNEADIIIAKHRNGPTGTAVLFFRKNLTQFTNIKKTDVNLGDF
jgi:replicative DNA helicase